MERREHYDPEDIEGLLSERSFDELLAEEKAFVLRHISDREEYERMRTMLHYMRPDEGSRATIDADAAVRTNVLAAFNAQQQPQWRIWLSSISTWLVPRDGSALWRPALALASLVVLIVAGVFSVRQFDATSDTGGLAELHEFPAKPTLPKATVNPDEDSAESDGSGRSTDTSNSLQQPAPITSVEGLRNEAQKAFGEVNNEGFEQRLKVAEVAESTNYNSALSDEMEERSTDAIADDRTVSREAKTDQDESINKDQRSTADLETPRQSHEVTQEEFLMNQSMANATGATRGSSVKKAKSLPVAAGSIAIQSQSIAQDPSIVGLIAQGW